MEFYSEKYKYLFERKIQIFIWEKNTNIYLREKMGETVGGGGIWGHILIFLIQRKQKSL